MAPSSSLTFKVRRREPELVLPAGPIPCEIKRLSNIDDQGAHWFQMPGILFYRSVPGMKDPVGVIRDALARALVYYYPYAGRLKEVVRGRKLAVDCTGEVGVLYIEADADVALEDFGAPLHPPFPCMDEFLFDVPGSADILNSPLLLIQVTRLACGGFIFAYRNNHTMSDATGFGQFLEAVGELARGKTIPSVQPIWERHRLEARNPPRVSFPHSEYDRVPGSEGEIVSDEDMICRSFFFGSTEISALFHLVPRHLRCSTTFEILTAYLWRTRTAALRPEPDKLMRLRFVADVRPRFDPPLPRGYYGNVVVFPAAVAAAEDLITKPLSFALELVKQAKEQVTEEYIKSAADLMVFKKRRPHRTERTYFVSDLRHAKFGEIDFGWGKPVYAGTATIIKNGSFYVASKNTEGEDGTIVPICLPAPAMARFVAALDRIVRDHRRGSSGRSTISTL